MLDVEVLAWCGFIWSAVGCIAKFQTFEDAVKFQIIRNLQIYDFFLKLELSNLKTSSSGQVEYAAALNSQRNKLDDAALRPFNLCVLCSLHLSIRLRSVSSYMATIITTSPVKTPVWGVMKPGHRMISYSIIYPIRVERVNQRAQYSLHWHKIYHPRN